MIKEFGLGLGVAILVEALLTRLFLFSAVMKIPGDRAWSIPAWLDRILPHPNLDGFSIEPPASARAPVVLRPTTSRLGCSTTVQQKENAAGSAVAQRGA